MLRRSTVLLCCLLLLAAALRFYQLDAQSLWSDEGSSVAQAWRDLPAIADNAARDIHPPFYYSLLHFWVMPFGTSEMGVRSLSAVLGVLLVWCCYLLAKELYAVPTALVAAALAAINPFQIYYAQEARMYMLLATLSAVAVYATIQATRPNAKAQRVWYGVYLVSAVLGLYTHYLFPIVLLVTNLIVCAQWVSERVKHRHPQRHSDSQAQRVLVPAWFLQWCLVQIVALCAFLPWLPIAIRQLTTWPTGAQTFTASDAPLVVLRTLSLGLSVTLDEVGGALWFGACALSGLLGRHEDTDARRSAVPAWFILLVYLFAPIAVMFAFALFKDAFLKFLIVASPPFVLLLANGVWRMAYGISHLASRVWCIANPPCAMRHAPYAILCAVLVLLSLPTIQSLRNYYFDPRFARDDYRAIAQLISALARDDAAIILDAPGQQEIFRYYYHGTLPIYLLPSQRPPDATQTESELATIAAQHTRLFVVFWATAESDPQRLVETWLDAHTFKASDSWYGNVRLALYANPRASMTMQQVSNVRWGDSLTLMGYTLATPTVSAGDVLPLTLFWRTDQPISTRYKVFVHLLDPRGFVIAQRDAEPVGGSRPTTTWRVGETLSDPYGLFIPFGTPPRSYQIEIGLYDLNTGQRLKHTAGEDRLWLKPVQIERASFTPPLAAYNFTPLDSPAVNGLQLVGYRADKLGAEGQPLASWRAGDALHLTLFWRKVQPTTHDGAYQWQLGTASKQTPPTDGLYPVAQWREGDIVRDDQLMVLPSDWQAGSYRLSVNGQKIGEVELR